MINPSLTIHRTSYDANKPLFDKCRYLKVMLTPCLTNPFIYNKKLKTRACEIVESDTIRFELSFHWEQILRLLLATSLDLS